MASLLDLITDTRNAARPNSAKVASSRTAGAATLACDNLSGWPIASKVHFVTYQIDSSSNPVAGTQLDCVGIVSGNSLTSLTVKDGTDSGNAINDVVEMLPTAAWGQDLATALTTEHDRTGKHTNITATSLTNTGNSTIGGNQTIAGALSVTGASTHTGASTFTGAIGGAGYDAKTIANSYKFSVYASAGQSIGIGATAKIQLNAKEFDTGSNFDAVTNFRFTAPVAGFYFIHATVAIAPSGMNATGNGIGLLYKNGVEFKRGAAIKGTGDALSSITSQVTSLISLAANDFIELFGYNGDPSSARTTGGGANTTYLSGFLVSAT